jgi:hypothetical protein
MNQPADRRTERPFIHSNYGDQRLKMTKVLAWTVIAVLTALLASAEEKPILITEQDKINYAMGINFVRKTLMQQPGVVNLDLVIQGMRDAVAGESLLLSESEIRMAGAAGPAGTGPSERRAAEPRLENSRAADIENKKAADEVVQLASVAFSGGSGTLQEQDKQAPADYSVNSFSRKGITTRAQTLIDRNAAARANTTLHKANGR